MGSEIKSLDRSTTPTASSDTIVFTKKLRIMMNMRVRREGCKKVAAKVWKHCDKNGDKHISWKEASGCGAPKQWKPKFDAVAGKDGLVAHKEFMEACKAHSRVRREGCKKVAAKVWKHCDKDGDKHLSWKEASGCGAPKKVKPAFLHVAGKDGLVAHKEFMAACKAHGGR